MVCTRSSSAAIDAAAARGSDSTTLEITRRAFVLTPSLYNTRISIAITQRTQSFRNASAYARIACALPMRSSLPFALS